MDQPTTPIPEPRIRRGKLDPVLVASAIEQTRGNLCQVAKRFGVTRQAVQGLVRRTPSLQVVLHDAKESMIDEAESALQMAVLRGESWAICFFLKTQAKNRGYVEKQQVQIDAESIRELITAEVLRLTGGSTAAAATAAAFGEN